MSKPELSASEALHRRMMAMAAREEAEEALCNDTGLEVSYPVAPEGKFPRKTKTGALTSTMRIGKESIGPLLGVKGAKFHRLQVLPGVSSMEFDKASGQLVFTTTSLEYQKRTMSIIRLSIDRSWPSDLDEETSDEIDDGIYRRVIRAPKTELQAILPRLNPLSNVKGIIRILLQPREEQKKSSFLILIDYFTEKSGSDVVTCIKKLAEGKGYSPPASAPVIALKPKPEPDAESPPPYAEDDDVRRELAASDWY